MNLKAGYPFWLIKNGLPFDYPKLDRSIKKDVVVMGGGISGALVAFYLTQQDIECVVVDGRTIGLGSTCASTSILQYEIDVPLTRLTKLIGAEDARRAYRLCARAITKLGEISNRIGFAEFEVKNSLYFAAYNKHVEFLQDEFLARKEIGFDVEFLDPKSIKKIYGFDASAAILSTEAAQVNAYMLTHALLQYCRKKGQLVFDRTTIAKIKHEKNGVEMQTESGDRISAKKLVYATGYEVVNYVEKPIVKLHSTYATISEHSDNVKHLMNDCVIWNTADPYLYMRSTIDGRILVGGRDEQFVSPALRDKLINRKSKQLANDFNKLFPDSPLKTEFSWCGTFGATKDGLPFIGPYPKLSNSLFALGFGGNGITFSQVAGEFIAKLIKGKAHKKDIELFSFNRV